MKTIFLLPHVWKQTNCTIRTWFSKYFVLRSMRAKATFKVFYCYVRMFWSALAFYKNSHFLGRKMLYYSTVKSSSGGYTSTSERRLAKEPYKKLSLLICSVWIVLSESYKVRHDGFVWSKLLSRVYFGVIFEDYNQILIRAPTAKIIEWQGWLKNVFKCKLFLWYTFKINCYQLAFIL